MKFIKKILKFIFWVIVLLGLVLVGLYLSAGFLIKTAVSTIVPPITQTTATVQNVDISLFSGKVALQGLAIGNPAGFTGKNIFELKEIVVLFNPKSVLTDNIVVNQVKIDGVTVVAEMNAKMDTNLNVLNKNIQSFLGGKSDTAKNKPDTGMKSAKKNSEKSVIIKDLTVSDTHLEAGVASKSVVLALPTIQLKNVGQDNKKTVGDVIALVLDKITLESVTAFAKASKDLIKDQIKSLSDGIKGTSKNVSDNVSSGINSLKSMF